MEGFAILRHRRTGKAVAVEMHVWRIAAAFEGAEMHYEHIASTATKSAALARVARINASRKSRTVSFASAMAADAFSSARR